MPAAQRRVERVLDQRALARAADAGDQAQHAERKLDGDVLADCCRARRPGESSRDSVRRRLAGDADAAAAGEKIAGEAVWGSLRISCGRALKDDFAAPLAGAGADFDDLSAARIIASSCSTTTTVLPRSRKPSMRSIRRSTSRGCRPTDGSSSTYSMLTRLEPSARGERDALRFAAAERAQRAIERQIAQADRPR